MNEHIFSQSLKEMSTLHNVQYLQTKDVSDFNIKAAYYIRKMIQEKQSVNEDGYVVIGLSGGKTPIEVYRKIAQIKDVPINKEKLIFFIIDERYKSDTHAHSNYHNINFFFKDLGINEKEQVIRPDTNKNIVDCVIDYNEKIKLLLKKHKKIDIVILGMGNDFHIASLFPNVFYNIYINNYQNNYIYNENILKDVYEDNSINNTCSDKVIHMMKEYVYFTTTNQFDVRKRITVSLNMLGNASNKIFLLNTQEKLDLWKKMLLNSYVEINYSSYPAVYLIDTNNTSVVTCGYNNYVKMLEEIYITKQSDFNDLCCINKKELLTIIVFGCSGDLAKKKIYPALFKLFCNKLLPKYLLIIGFARTSQTFECFFDNIVIYLKKCLNYYEDLSVHQKRDLLNAFKRRCKYYIGNYASSDSFEKFNIYLNEQEKEILSDLVNDEEEENSKIYDTKEYNHCAAVTNRILYLSLPPHVFVNTLSNYKKNCTNKNGFEKIILEKPFGKDQDSFQILSKKILEHYNEESIYRIDHYLGKDMVSGLLKLKFSNMFLLSLMNRHFIKCIKVTLKETKGVYGRGQYFDPYGIIRDVMQNHMLQLLTLITMDYPTGLNDEAIQNEKIKILRCIPSIKLKDTIVGQYVKSENYEKNDLNDDNCDESQKNHSYHDDPHIDKNSITPTFCTCILYINSINWYGVPIIFKTGKGLNRNICEIRIQFHNIMGSSDDNMYNNEFVIVLQPIELIYLKMLIKKPGSSEMEEKNLNLTLNEQNKNVKVAEAYETLLLECFKGCKKNFISKEELYESWRIFTPLLNELQEKQIKPLKYPFGSSGPAEVHSMVKKYYNYGSNYYNSPEFTKKASFYDDALLDIN
ncbi:glucose-6-phosphate dehydrogenase-6-phosphogluconolactonase [Hepatocystis sp. ex Piliocolobus tephrosceles]|nr:glucose-6-phosphate dehydrogenase-6-phosphogluconolactonase [Hepatocystis sp. ex Piliocolobus tephrosceles]